MSVVISVPQGISLRQHLTQRIHGWLITSLGALYDGSSCRRQKLEHLREGLTFRRQSHGSLYQTFYLKIISSLQRSFLNSEEHTLLRFTSCYLSVPFAFFLSLHTMTFFPEYWKVNYIHDCPLSLNTSVCIS